MATMSVEKLAKKMIEYRAKQDISMRELANRCGLTVQTICNIENGVQTPSRITTQKILNVIDAGE